ncbi:MAG: hypothetical protein MI864_15980 [Pseudomonadales bacterium]|nr:hypothetical protein [Pseudomonadales bacterium]
MSVNKRLQNGIVSSLLKSSVLVIAGAAFVGCSAQMWSVKGKNSAKNDPDLVKTPPVLPVSPPKPVLTVNATQDAVDISSVLEGYKFSRQLQPGKTTIAFVIAYDPSDEFHVPWFVAPEQDLETEVILIDPARQLVSVGVNSADIRCDKHEISERKAIADYSVCSSQFSIFSNPEKESSKTVKTDVYRMALVARQLNLTERARDWLERGDEALDVTSRETAIRSLNRLAARYEGRLERLQDNYINGYIERASSSLDIERKISDRSGYFNYDVRWDDQVELIPERVVKRSFDFKTLINPLKTAASLGESIHPIVKVIQRRIEQNYDTERKGLLRYLRDATAKYTVVCSHSPYIGDYQVNIKCPGAVNANASPLRLPISYEVVARRFGVMLPRFAMHNSDLGMELDEFELTLKNHSNRKVRIGTVSISANRVQQYLNLGVGAKGIELSPGEERSFDIRPLLTKEVEQILYVSYVQNRKAVRDQMKFGAEISYLPSDEVKHQKLERVLNYNLDQVLVSKY